MQCALIPLSWPGSLLFNGMVGMARCAVPARVVAGGTNARATLAIEGVAPLHAARTSQRDVPTTKQIQFVEQVNCASDDSEGFLHQQEFAPCGVHSCLFVLIRG